MFWETGLRRQGLSACFINGNQVAIDPSRIDDSVFGGIQEAIPQIQQLTYYGHIDNFVNIFDYLMDQKGVSRSINPEISQFAGRVLPLAATSGVEPICRSH